MRKVILWLICILLYSLGYSAQQKGYDKGARDSVTTVTNIVLTSSGALEAKDIQDETNTRIATETIKSRADSVAIASTTARTDINRNYEEASSTWSVIVASNTEGERIDNTKLDKSTAGVVIDNLLYKAEQVTSTGTISISLNGSLWWQDTSTGTGVCIVLGSTINVTEMCAYAQTAPTNVSYVSIANQNNTVIGSSLTFGASEIFTNTISSPTAVPKSTRLYLHSQAITGDSLRVYIKYWKNIGQ